MNESEVDALLAYIRNCANQYKADGSFGANVVDGFLVLDEHLARGGPLPGPWRTATA